MTYLELDHAPRRQFLLQLKARAHDQGFFLHDGLNPGFESDKAQSLYKGTRERNVGYHYSVKPGEIPYVSVSVYDDKEPSRNQALFDALQADQTAIEHAFGAPLVWDRHVNLGASIRYYFNDSATPASPTDWTRWQDAMIDAMRRLHGAVQPFIDALPAQLHRTGRPRP